MNHKRNRDDQATLAGESNTRDHDQVVKHQHAASLSALTGGITHRLNNVLSGVLGGAFMIRQKLPPDSELERNLALIEKAGEEATALSEQLLAFTRRDTTARSPIDIRSLMEDCVFFLENVIDRRIQLETKIDSAGALVLANPSLLLQALTNVGMNAAESIDGEGSVLIEVSIVTPSGPNDTAELVIAVSDTGAGINEDAQRRLFEPYFTTKNRDAHTGLGLAATTLIVSAIGGTVSLQSTGPAGSCFAIRLPTHQESAKNSTGSEGTPVPQGKGCILAVDDEPSLLRLMTVYLSSLGYEVLSAIHGQQAVEIFQANKEKIVLSIIDLSMPVMDGPECFKALKAIQPEVKVIFTTGHQIEEVLAEQERNGAVGSIKKPFKPAELGALVNNALKS